MMPDIFQFLQAQVNTQAQALGQNTGLQQDNSGTQPGIFDALITEYTLPPEAQEVQPQVQAQSVSMPQIFRSNNTLSASVMSVLTGETPEVPEQDTQPQTLQPEALRGLFSGIKARTTASVTSRNDTETLSDFDAGVVPVVPQEENVQPQSASLEEATNTKPAVITETEELPSPQVSNDIPSVPEAVPATQSSDTTEEARPSGVEVRTESEAVVPDNRAEVPHTETAENVTLEPSVDESPEIPAEPRNTAETSATVETEEPADIPQSRSTSAKKQTAPSERTENEAAPSTVSGNDNTEGTETHTSAPEVRAESQEVPAESTRPLEAQAGTPEAQSSETVSTPAIPANSAEEAEATDDDEASDTENTRDEEAPVRVDMPNIPEAANMAGLQAVQTVSPQTVAASPETTEQEALSDITAQPTVSEAPSGRQSSQPQCSNTQRRSQVSQSGGNESVPETSLEHEAQSAPRVSTRQETGQNPAGHEDSREGQNISSGVTESASEEPSIPTLPRTGSGTARRTETPRTQTERTTSSQDFRRTEARSDFQSFFDGAIRARRTSSTAPAEPLSLRTGTYTPTQAGTLREGIVNTVRFIRADGVRKANIVVDPPALGRITVELTSSTSGVEASVKVASEQIRQIVQEQIAQLRDNLSQQGVQVSEFTVDVQQDNSGQGQNQNSGRENQRSPYSFAGGNTDDDAEDFRIDLEEGLLYWVA